VFLQTVSATSDCVRRIPCWWCVTMVLWTVARCVLQSLSRTVWVSFQHLLGYQNFACLELTLSSLCIDPVVVSLFHWVCCASLLVRWCTVPLWNKLTVTRMRTASEARENDGDTSTLSAGNYQRVTISRSVLPAKLCALPRIPSNQMRAVCARVFLPNCVRVLLGFAGYIKRVRLRLSHS